MIEKPAERLRIEHPDVGLGRRFLPVHKPFGEDDDRSNGEIRSLTAIIQQIREPTGLSAHLVQGFVKRPAVLDAKHVAVMDNRGTTLRGFGPSLRFDSKHSGWADKHMVKVEAGTGDIMQHPVTLLPERGQDVGDDSFTFIAHLEISDVGLERPNPYNGKSYDGYCRKGEDDGVNGPFDQPLKPLVPGYHKKAQGIGQVVIHMLVK